MILVIEAVHLSVDQTLYKGGCAKKRDDSRVTREVNESIDHLEVDISTGDWPHDGTFALAIMHEAHYTVSTWIIIFIFVIELDMVVL